MPVGVPWPEYLSFFTAAMLSMAAGAQTVHWYYNPMKDFDKVLAAERKRLREYANKPQ